MSTDTFFNPFELPLKNRLLANLGGTLLGLSPLAKHYAEKPNTNGAESFLDYAFRVLSIDVDVESSERLDHIPKTGPVLVVANHPLGGLEGLAIAQLLLKIRPDVQILTNELLTRVPELSDIFIGVDVLSSKAAHKNVRGMRKAIKHLRNDGMLLIFPAGQVSAINLKNRRIEDRPWNRLVGQLVKKTSAISVPIYVKGQNSCLFYLLGLIHPRLRTLMLARELSNKRGSRIALEVGEPVTQGEIQQLTDHESVTHYLRMSTDLLGADIDSTNSFRRAEIPDIPLPASDLTVSVERLAKFELIGHKQFVVYCAPFDALGPLMEQIGIAREITFRAVGEGSGNAIDIDQFDPHYMHLFVWDKERHVVAGSYRVGHTDEIVAEHGIDGLYGRTLYRFDQAYLERIGGAIEVGRSFVHPDYQRYPAVLDLLWRGIGRYIVKNPKYHTLFGAVSISRDHSDMARALISESMLESHRADDKFLEDVEPLTPLKMGGKIWTSDMLSALNKVTVLNKLVGRCDPGKTLPILIRHYLSLNGKFVCFSVNTDFNDSLDGLILVDLRKMPARYLKRYMGKEGAEILTSKWSEVCKQS